METIEFRSGKINIRQDSCCDSPRDWDNLGVMVCFHKKYSLGDNHDLKHGDFKSWLQMEEHIWMELDAGVLMPLYLYDHGGITISINPFSCPWDSGQVGFIYASKEAIRKEYGKKHISKATLKKAQEILESEVEVYDQFIRGDVYGYQTFDPNGDEIHSCWGYYGSDCEKNGLMSDARGSIDWYFKKEAAAEHFQQTQFAL